MGRPDDWIISKVVAPSKTGDRDLSRNPARFWALDEWPVRGSAHARLLQSGAAVYICSGDEALGPINEQEKMVRLSMRKSVNNLNMP